MEKWPGCILQASIVRFRVFNSTPAFYDICLIYNSVICVLRITETVLTAIVWRLKVGYEHFLCTLCVKSRCVQLKFEIVSYNSHGVYPIPTNNRVRVAQVELNFESLHVHTLD